MANAVKTLETVSHYLHSLEYSALCGEKIDWCYELVQLEELVDGALNDFGAPASCSDSATRRECRLRATESHQRDAGVATNID
jgi:hypothetical protein